MGVFTNNVSALPLLQPGSRIFSSICKHSSTAPANYSFIDCLRMRLRANASHSSSNRSAAVLLFPSSSKKTSALSIQLSVVHFLCLCVCLFVCGLSSNTHSLSHSLPPFPHPLLLLSDRFRWLVIFKRAVWWVVLPVGHPRDTRKWRML